MYVCVAGSDIIGKGGAVIQGRNLQHLLWLSSLDVTGAIPIFGYIRVFKEYPQKSQIWKS